MGLRRGAFDLVLAALVAVCGGEETRWFFGADAEWTGPAGYKKNLVPDAEATARRGTDLRWARNASACGAPPYNYTCSPSSYAALSLPRVGDPCDAVDGLSVLFVGDSYARHAYVALALLLSGDMRSGAIKAGLKGSADCVYAKQFGEHAKKARRGCRLFVAKRLGESLCGGRVRMRLAESPCPDVTPQHLLRNHIVVYGMGAHPCRLAGAKGPKHLAYNASAFSEGFARPLCADAGTRERAAKQVIWLDTHFRPTSFGPYDGPDRVFDFHRRAPETMRTVCAVSTVSAYDDSRALVATAGSSWRRMTFDGVHWGLQINVIKALRVVERIAAMRRSP